MTDENIINKAYEAIELAVKTGKIKKGTNEVTKAIERGIAKLVLVAGDVNPPEVILHLEPLCKEKETLFVKVPSREELGAAAGLGLTTSSVAIVEPGDATGVIKEISKILSPKEVKVEKEIPKVEAPKEVKVEKEIPKVEAVEKKE